MRQVLQPRSGRGQVGVTDWSSSSGNLPAWWLWHARKHITVILYLGVCRVELDEDEVEKVVEMLTNRKTHEPA